MNNRDDFKREVESLQKKNALLEQALQQSKVIKEKFIQSSKLLKQKDKELKDLNSLLEDKVIQRTEELKAERNYLQLLLDINPDIIVVTDGLNLKKANRSFFDIFHYNSLEQFLKDHDCICDFFVTLNKKPFNKEKTIQGKIWTDYIISHLKEVNIVQMQIEEKIFFFNIVASRLDSNDILIIFTDITYIKKQEEKLHKSEKLASMGEMIGNIAHQWRQPLSVISTAATGLQMKNELNILEKNDLEKMCEIINDNAQYLSKTIDDFRDFIKGDSQIVDFYIHKNINAFIKLIDTSIKKYSIQMILNLKEDRKIKGYPNELIQVFINIFNNAKDAFLENNIDEDERYIFISQYIKNNKITIKFKDNAGGIPNDIINKIFEPYFTTKYKSQGTGLGLYMAYDLIINGIGGTIEVQNTHYKFNNKNFTGALFKIEISLENEISK